MHQALSQRSVGHRCSSGAVVRVCPAATHIRRSRPLQLKVTLHGHGATKFDPNAEKNKGFVNEMRMVAMKMHTKDQAVDGGRPAVQRTWQPTVDGYARFLAESKAVYDTLERIIAESTQPEYAALRASGLERSAALSQDLAWFRDVRKVPIPEVDPTGPGAAYCKQLQELAASDPPAFICHYYNFYFAHTAGGRMIGNKISSTLLDNQELAFYKYEGDVQALLDGVRKKINEMSEHWTREQKDHCLQVTAESFKYSGAIMQCISGGGGH